MTARPLTPREASLVGNARRFERDDLLEPIADAMDRGDTAAWTRAHPALQDRAGIYRDLRAEYREAVDRGLFDPNDPTAA